jgi:hypothetical protein
MSNPTLNTSQFNSSFNILPDVIYTNPTSTKPSQFNSPFNILPDVNYTNPTIGKITGVPATNIWTPLSAQNTNITTKSTGKQLLGFAASAASSFVGIPQISQIANSFLDSSLSATYSTLPLSKLYTPPFIKLSDFRSRISIDESTNLSAVDKVAALLTTRRLDGASSLLRGSYVGGAYAAASVTPIGPYSIFNLNGNGDTGYGWGDHDNPSALRNDFTVRSHVATRWVTGELDPTSKTRSKGKWAPTKNPIERVIPFRGDRVTVIDFSKRTEKQAYLWNPISLNGFDGAVGAVLNALGLGGTTQDFIKFYFTGPALRNGAPAGSDPDDIIVFRATLGSLSDSFQANWTPVNMIGRADPNYQYTGYSRDVSLDFTVYATDRDELKPIYRKLNALAGYMAPTYLKDSIAMQAPWMRLTIGDLFHQQPVILTSLDYTLVDQDTTWEINIEKDPTMMQVPHKVTVRCSFTMISDFLPQKGGRFYSLAKEYDTNGNPIAGNSNWLSDSLDNVDALPDATQDPNSGAGIGRRNTFKLGTEEI